MRARIVGTEGDVRGGRLAGVEGTVCRTRAEAEAAFDQVEAEAEDLALVLISAPVAALVPARLAALLDRAEGPVLLVLPELGAGGVP